MERRYLVAALAIIATFAVTTRSFRALQRMSLGNDHHFWTMVRVGAMARAKCPASSAARAMAKVRTHLRPRYPEEAQLLAEMNVPIAGMETIQAQMARQDEAIARCARARAMQDAERARRDALRLQQRMMRAAGQANMAPIALHMSLPTALDQQIQTQMTILASRLAANSVKLQMAANKFSDPSMVAVTVDGRPIAAQVHTHVHCNVDTRTAWQQQSQQAVRYAVHPVEYGFTSK